MKMPSGSRLLLAGLVLLALVPAFSLGSGSTAVWASEGDMPGMPGMTQEEMQAMEQPQSTVHTEEQAPEASEGAHGETGAGSANWYVIGAFLAVVTGTTVAAATTKRRLAHRIATGELAGAGALNV